MSGPWLGFRCCCDLCTKLSDAENTIDFEGSLSGTPAVPSQAGPSATATGTDVMRLSDCSLECSLDHVAYHAGGGLPLTFGDAPYSDGITFAVLGQGADGAVSHQWHCVNTYHAYFDVTGVDLERYVSRPVYYGVYNNCSTSGCEGIGYFCTQTNHYDFCYKTEIEHCRVLVRIGLNDDESTVGMYVGTNFWAKQYPRSGGIPYSADYAKLTNWRERTGTIPTSPIDTTPCPGHPSLSWRLVFQSGDPLWSGFEAGKVWAVGTNYGTGSSGNVLAPNVTGAFYGYEEFNAEDFHFCADTFSIDVTQGPNSFAPVSCAYGSGNSVLLSPVC